ncbi:hypothetical protein MC7420_1025 [Coleofasciculus chthonoplastes PCC 7420]|uniref:Uncharacterized protein n=1 Tax=Coleofasciculus chthonoplastes PCC 7420 TaxID=118168 RepID=B4W0D6_9CYAN|nr:hypothetical protein MC7420_1025 [Coleofasciculus chthonoplastes PCC 7420]
MCTRTFLSFPPHPLTPSPTQGRRGTGLSCSPLTPLSQAWERGWG